MSYTATVLQSLEVAARNFLSFISDKVSAITTAGWVFVAVGFVAGVWAWAVMHASTRIGPIEVEDLKADDKDLPLLALTGAFRQSLSEVGLAPPPAVPEGSPQANLINAVEAIAPQGAAIAKMLQLLPMPPQPLGYKVAAILENVRTVADARPASTPTTVSSPPIQNDETVMNVLRATVQKSPAAKDCGVSYTVQPASRGAPHVQTVTGYDTCAAALDRAAVEIYQHIAKSLPEVFPHWVRWRTPESLEAYLEGFASRRSADLDGAAAHFKTAVDTSPFNALATLHLANVNERRAGRRQGDWDTAYFQAQALARYRATGILWPAVVEARYRASVVSSSLATAYADLAVPEKAAIRAIVPFAGLVIASPEADSEYVAHLRNFAARESSATLQLLHPLYAFLRLHRLRNQFESKGNDRRALRDVVWISRQCVRVRRLNQRDYRFRQVLEVRYRAFRVVLRTWSNLSWQARYNASCFWALRLGGDLITGRPEQVRLPWLFSERKRRGRTERRALRNLDRAIREALGELGRDFINNDPDMRFFRLAEPAKPSADARAAWKEILARAPAPSAIETDSTRREASKASPESPTAIGSAAVSSPTDPMPLDQPTPSSLTPWDWEDAPDAPNPEWINIAPAEEDPESIVRSQLPKRPWGSPIVREWLWGATFVATVLVFVFLAVRGSMLYAAIAVLAGAWVLRRFGTAFLERELDSDPRIRKLRARRRLLRTPLDDQDRERDA